MKSHEFSETVDVFNIWKVFSIILSINLSAGDEIGVHDCNENTVKKKSKLLHRPVALPVSCLGPLLQSSAEPQSG